MSSPLLTTQLPPCSTSPPAWLEPKLVQATTDNRKIDNIIFDIGSVLFTWTWSVNGDISISSKILYKILRTVTWFEYEKGSISEEETYRRVANEFSLDASEVGAAFRAARDTLQINTSMITLLRELKKNGNVRLFVVSNISALDWEVLQHKCRPADWALFEHVFTSAAIHERKPNLGYFRHVLESTGIDPSRTAFVDNRLENVVSARSFGLKGIVYTSFEAVSRELRALLRDPIGDGERYLRNHAKQMKSVTDSGIVVEENFTQYLILEATGDPSLVDYTECPRLCNFLKSVPVPTTDSYPDDLDTTSLASTVLPDRLSQEAKSEIMDEMLAFKNKDGIIQPYFDAERPRIDPIVCVNVLTFFYSNGRGDELMESFDWVSAVLKNRAYVDGTHYYYGPDIFLFFLSRLLSTSTYARQRLGQLFTKRVVEQFGTDGDALSLAMRIHAAATVDLCDSQDYNRLAKMQEADGSWPIGWAYRFAITGILIGNKGMTTALAVSAMRRYQELELRSSFFD